ncbi:hypothetical protein EJ08DRAFT_437590 [Tothia fuscella]|uniref:Uncharacterized protein n=1 Tax=Tothia fuscella TaxID=1048955 RepID=A0A9P4U3G3_9PEZI|nr:hypothetical protein EJ08DRAFT_437590 [Tothia fuscella]
MDKLLESGLKILYYIYVPFVVLFRLLNLIVIQPMWYILSLVVQPFIYIGYFFTAAAGYPLRFLATFETLWIYLSTAALIGLLSGGILYFSATFLTSLLRLETSDADKVHPTPKRTIADYRAKRRQKKFKSPYPLSNYGTDSSSKVLSYGPPTSSSTLLGESGGWPTTGPFASSTILEEDGSDLS